MRRRALTGRIIALAVVALLGGAPLACATGVATEGAADMDATARALLEGSTWVNGDPKANCSRAALDKGVGGYELYVANIGWPFWITLGGGGKQDSTLITALKLAGDRLTVVFSDRSRREWRVETHDRIANVSDRQILSRCPGARLSKGLPLPGE